jgi:hypothetical protein
MRPVPRLVRVRVVPVAFVKLRYGRVDAPVAVRVANVGVEVTETMGVPVAEVRSMFEPAERDCTPTLVNVTVEGEVDVDMVMPAPGENMKFVSVRPARVEVTKGLVFVKVTVPVAFETEMPVPAAADWTPSFSMVMEPAAFCMPIAVPGVRVPRA